MEAGPSNPEIRDWLSWIAALSAAITHRKWHRAVLQVKEKKALFLSGVSQKQDHISGRSWGVGGAVKPVDD